MSEQDQNSNDSGNQGANSENQGAEKNNHAGQNSASGSNNHSNDHHQKLLDEAKKAKAEKRQILESLSALGINTESGADIGEQLKALLSGKEEAIGKSKGENDILKSNLEKLTADFSSLQQTLQQEAAKREQAELSKRIFSAFDSLNVSSKGKDLLEMKLKQGLQKNESGEFYHKDGEKIFTIEDYASKLASEFPELIEGSSSRFGTGTRSINKNQTSVAEAYDSGNLSAALQAQLKKDKIL